MSPCLELVLDLIWDSSVKFLVGRSWLRNSRDLDPRSREDLEEGSLEKSLGCPVASLDCREESLFITLPLLGCRLDSLD